MTKDAVNQYDSTAANNTDVGGVNLGEGTGAGAMYPSDVNNAFREIMSHLKDVDAGTSSMTSPDINGGTIDGTTIGGSSAAAGTFTTLSATGNTTLGDAAGDVTQNKGGFAAQGTGLPASGSGVEINFGLVAGEGTVQAFDRSGSAWEQLRLRGNQVAFDISGTEKMRIDSSGNVGIGISSGLADLLTVSESPGTAYQIRIDTNGGFTTGNYSGIEFTQSNASQKGEIRLDHTSAGAANLVFGTSDGASNADRFHIQNTGVWVENAAGPALLNEAASSTNPTLVPNRAAPTYGIGAASSTAMSLIGGGVETLRWNSTTLLPKVTTQFIDGSAAAPSIAFASDTDNGFYLATTNTIGFSTGGTERMRIDSSGNLVVGTTSAATDLAYAPKLKLSGNGPGLYFEETDASQDYSIAALGGKFYIRDATAVAPRLTIDNSGDVGIGTANLSTYGGKLSIVDGAVGGETTLVLANNSQDQFARLGINNNEAQIAWDNADALVFGTATTSATAGLTSEFARIDSSGRLGLGTSSPSSLMHIASTGDAVLTIEADTDNVTEGDNPQLRFVQDGGITTSRIGFADGTNRMEFVNEVGDGIAFGTSDTERMRILGGGHAGLGTSSPGGPIDITDGSTYQTKVSTTGDLVVKATAGGDLLQLVDAGATSETNSNPHMEFLYATSFGGGQTRLGYFGYGSTSNSHMRIVNETSSGYVTFHTANTERMVITNGGDLRVGQATDSTPGFNDTNTGGAWSSDGTSLHLSRDSNAVAWFNRNATTGTVQSFRYDGSAVGSISVTASATAYNTSSDYRLKENVVGLSGAIDRVKLLKPSRFNFIVDPDTTVDGFVAHEVSDIVPEAVHGAKDAVDEDGNPDYQGIDQSKLVPLLTAALQEAVNKIETLEARVAALEAA